MNQTMGTPRHIVVVDSDRIIRASLVDYLKSNGFTASGTADAHTLERTRDGRHADLVIVDLALPGAAGFTLCASLRESLRVPVIAISAQAEDVDRILALEVGADDFVAKPFNPREVLARVRNVLRRFDTTSSVCALQTGERYCFAGWTLDTTTRALYGSTGDLVPLAGGEFELLLALVTNANRVLTRDELIELTKGRGAQPFDRSIDVKISRLRQRLRDHSRDGRIIRAIYGKGYVLATSVALQASDRCGIET
jgi:two-component system OmpR family response regulator